MDNFIDKLGEILRTLTFFESVKPDVYRLIELVQSNQEFFGNPPIGQSCIRVAADKLEQLIKEQSITIRKGE